MKNVLKSTLATTAGVSALMASSIAAAASFNVVIDKIELVDDASDVTAGEGIVTVYEPTTTTTVDLFNTTSAAGTSFSLTTPADGVYDAAIITFSTVEISGTTNAGTIDYAAVLETSNQAFDMNAGDDSGKTKLVLGSVGTGLASVDDILSANASQTTGSVSAITATPIVVTSGSFTLPTLNIKLDSSTVDDTASSLALTTAPVLSTIKATTSVDSTSVGDLTVGVDLNQFAGVTGFTSGTSVINLGLFTAETSERPIVQTELTTSTTYATGASGTTYEFVDVAGTVCPIAWFDADGDDLLDAGESITFSNATIATNCTTVGTTDVNYTQTAELLDETVVALAPRQVSVTIPIIKESEIAAATTANTDDDGSLIATAASTEFNDGIAILDSSLDGSLTIAIANDAANTAALRRSFVLAAALAEQADTSTSTDDISPTDIVNIVLRDEGATQATSETNVTYDDTNDQIVITAVPVFGATTYAADVENSGADYDLTITLDSIIPSATEISTSALGVNDAGGANAGEILGNDVTFGTAGVDLGDIL